MKTFRIYSESAHRYSLKYFGINEPDYDDFQFEISNDIDSDVASTYFMVDGSLCRFQAERQELGDQYPLKTVDNISYKIQELSVDPEESFEELEARIRSIAFYKNVVENAIECLKGWVDDFDPLAIGFNSSRDQRKKLYDGLINNNTVKQVLQRAGYRQVPSRFFPYQVLFVHKDDAHLVDKFNKAGGI